MSEGSAGRVIVFAKAPRAGLVKTRMSPPLSPEQAARLYGHMLDDVLHATADIAASLDLDTVLALHPPEDCQAFAGRVPTRFRVVAQRGPGLAERMTHAVAEAGAAGAEPILVRGSDSPALSLDHFESALSGLRDHDLVVAPDNDGGYALVGLRCPWEGLFDHPMSTRTVLDETVANARALGLRVAMLEASFDLDTVEDLRDLERARRSGRATRCPRTLAYLDESALWAQLSTDRPREL